MLWPREKDCVMRVKVVGSPQIVILELPSASPRACARAIADSLFAVMVAILTSSSAVAGEIESEHVIAPRESRHDAVPIAGLAAAAMEEHHGLALAALVVAERAARALDRTRPQARGLEGSEALRRRDRLGQAGLGGLGGAAPQQG